MKIEGYTHPDQHGCYGVICISGYHIYDYLIERGMLDRCLSVEDPIVNGWCEHPETYPEEFRNFDPDFDNKRVYLWKSARHASDRVRTLHVAYLRYSEGKVLVEWDQNLGQPFYNRLHLTALVLEEVSNETKV